jgi:hypothetical protein
LTTPGQRSGAARTALELSNSRKGDRDGTDRQNDPQEGDQPQRFIERIFGLEQEGLGKAIGFSLEWKREPDA